MQRVMKPSSSMMIFRIVQSQTEPVSGASVPYCLLHAGRVLADVSTLVCYKFIKILPCRSAAHSKQHDAM